MKIVDLLAIIIAIISILIPVLYVLDDINALNVNFPIQPMYLSLICLIVIAFLAILGDRAEK